MGRDANFFTVISLDSISIPVAVAKWLALPISDHKVPGSNPTRGGFQLMTVYMAFIAQSL